MKITLSFDSIDEFNAFIQSEVEKARLAAAPKDPMVEAFAKGNFHHRLTNAEAAQIRNAGNGIQQIKALRTIADIGLKEAKEFLETQGLGRITQFRS